jgi:Na+/H+-dicarboxylate symporter
MTKKISLTNKILIAMATGLLLGSLINYFAADQAIIQNYFVNGIFHVIGSAFINALKMLVVPLVTFSLICGVCGIGDIKALGRVGLKSFLLSWGLAWLT